MQSRWCGARSYTLELMRESYGETYRVSEHRLEGQRSLVEPPQGTISASRERKTACSYIRIM